ncbi:hypothetical protein FHS61_000819 [Altererythrobacter atlanticus]|uniref:Uncharacterized protein n=1 Tax=Croceibacterium atlanticum TaxID=1267766 RepID=A0A0F7KWA5_9SPHN|nr:phage tail protein [Croceibacterium atlanticum]AKH43477.1 hypothetical protein WYH_02447 [Croceibacterium atlanticum]MBB5731815.1 hypothetical protein [Croceibacterium atlanticum]
MASLVFTAIGTAIGGPLGGALGSLLGNRIDHAIFGSSGHREGPRLKELSVTTSSYGTPIPRHYGTMRAPGTIIWATDLIESSERSGGGKSRPSVTTYSYSASFAVALSSRPILGIGRIWADGNLLRGAAGDLKTGGELRIHHGHGDQMPDPLLASDLGDSCPAFRGTAYCVFESLQLADFGNRIPALTFEILSDHGDVSLRSMLEPVGETAVAARDLPGMAGFSDEGGPLASTLAALDELYPISCTVEDGKVTLRAGDILADEPEVLPAAVADASGEGFGATSGRTSRRRPDARPIPEAMRYYDPDRDFQAGMQFAGGRARPGRSRTIEFPGAFQASDARRLAASAAERASWAGEKLSWRMAELDPALAPGMAVIAPGRAGIWQIDSWEWREGFVELELHRLPPDRLDAAQVTDPGQNLPPADLDITPTVLTVFELPATGQTRQIHAAISSTGPGWRGAALYELLGTELEPIGASGTRRAIMGTLAETLAAAPAMRLGQTGRMIVELIASDFALDDATATMIANGANRALVGGEIVQFARATPLGGNIWELRGLLRGRGGTEALAMQGHPAGTSFILLDDRPIALDPAALSASAAPTIAALGRIQNRFWRQP